MTKQTRAVRSEDPAPYTVLPIASSRDDSIIAEALCILTDRLRATPTTVMNSPTTAMDYLRLRLMSLEHEVFTIMFLDVKNRLIACEEMFRGTLTQASVYPREVVKAALMHNAAGVILAHNHPSGEPEPSAADHSLTQVLKQALAMIDVRVLDHVIVAGSKTHSFAEHGQI